MTTPTDTEREPTTPTADDAVTDAEQTRDDVETSTTLADSGTAEFDDIDDIDDALADRPGPVGRVTAELRRVTWPTRRELVTYSLIVVTFLVTVTAAVAGVDSLFGALILRLLG